MKDRNINNINNSKAKKSEKQVSTTLDGTESMYALGYSSEDR